MLLIVSFGGFKSVFQQRGNGHGTNATRYGSDIAGALCSCSKVDVTDEGAVILTVNADSTDSAPHAKGDKESSCGCAGAYTAPAAIELYATAFEEMQALDKLEAFASLNGPRFYGLAPNTDTVTLERRQWVLPESYPYASGQTIVPLLAGETLQWAMKK